MVVDRHRLAPAVYDIWGWPPHSKLPRQNAVVVYDFIDLFTTLIVENISCQSELAHSTVTDFARFRGLSTSVPRAQAV